MPDTIADGLRHTTPARLPWEVNKVLLDDVITVTDTQIAHAMRWSFEQAIAYHGHPPVDDPNWRDSGAATRQAYGRWCLDYGGYVEEPDGRVTGLLYRQFSAFTRDRYQLPADVITNLDNASHQRPEATSS